MRAPTTIYVRELGSRIDEALAIVSSGGEVILIEGQVPRARLVPCEEAKPCVAGPHPGAFQTAKDFDEPLPDDLWSSRSTSASGALAMKYLIILEPTSTGFSAYSPDLDGRVAAGDDREETIALMREAIEFHLEGLAEAGDTILLPTSEPAYVEVTT
jgi:predicted RNase H-like HicB family nuclease/antitoxin (DNA-binding transcriptional repressor) of toxin-antitoxin stability system